MLSCGVLLAAVCSAAVTVSGLATSTGKHANDFTGPCIYKWRIEFELFYWHLHLQMTNRVRIISLTHAFKNDELSSNDLTETCIYKWQIWLTCEFRFHYTGGHGNSQNVNRNKPFLSINTKQCYLNVRRKENLKLCSSRAGVRWALHFNSNKCIESWRVPLQSCESHSFMNDFYVMLSS